MTERNIDRWIVFRVAGRNFVAGCRYLVGGVKGRRSQRTARRKAHATLRAQRPASDGRWSLEDWIWAHEQVGSPASHQAVTMIRVLQKAGEQR